MMISLIYLIFADYLLVLMTSHQNVILLSKEYLYWAIISPLISAPCFLLDGVMIGAMASATMRNSMIMSSLTLTILLLWSVPLYGNHALWFCFMLFMLLRGLSLIPKAIRLACTNENKVLKS